MLLLSCNASKGGLAPLDNSHDEFNVVAVAGVGI